MAPTNTRVFLASWPVIPTSASLGSTLNLRNWNVYLKDTANMPNILRVPDYHDPSFDLAAKLSPGPNPGPFAILGSSTMWNVDAS